MRNPNSKVRKISDFITNAGNRTHIRYEARFDGKGVKLEAVGSEDIQMSIDSFAPYTDLNYMLHRLSVGDTSVLSGRQAIYGDFSALPQNPVDMINVLNSAEQSFSQLPADEKAAFNNDYRVWLANLLNSASNTDVDISVSAKPVVEKPSVEEKGSVNSES